MMQSANISDDVINEFVSDLKKQCVMLMGLPGAGKSRWVNSGQLTKFIPGFKSYKITNSDVQLKGLQFRTAENHFKYLKSNIKTEDDVKKFVELTKYVNPWTKSSISVDLTFEWWEENKDKGLKNYYDTFNSSYYIKYFDVRDLAIDAEEKLFQTKIKESGNLLIIDTTGTNINKAQARFKRAHEEGFNTVVVYLEIEQKYSIARDKFRGEKGGRTVGPNVIQGYVDKIDGAFKEYQGVLKSKTGYVDRLIHLKWNGGSDPTKGTFKLVSDKRSTREFDEFKRKLKKKK